MIMKKISLIIIVLIISLLIFTTFTSKINPVTWEIAPNPGLIGDFKLNNKLAESNLILQGVGEGPEDIVQGPDGSFYTGYQDGLIIRFSDDGEYTEFINTGGRPLGLEFDKDGNLIVADAIKGLLLITQESDIEILTDAVDGKKMIFVDDLDIAEDGTIWFSDASQRFGIDENIYTFYEGERSGRLLSYNPHTKQTIVHLEDLFFANGVALGPEDNFVLVNETGTGVIHRLWLKGEKTGLTDIFFNGLPGNPDNITFNEKNTFWLGLAGIRTPVLDSLSQMPLLRKLLVGLLPINILTPPSNHGAIIGLTLDGNVRYNLQSTDGPFITTTCALQVGNQLIVGSLKSDFVGILALD